MGFNASDYAAPLEYDLGDNVNGTIPEPSSKAVNLFYDRLSHAVEKISGKPVPRGNNIELVKAIGALTLEQRDKLVEEEIDTICELTKNHPTKGQLTKAGHRVKQAFLGWLMGELRSPEGPRPATSS